MGVVKTSEKAYEKWSCLKRNIKYERFLQSISQDIYSRRRYQHDIDQIVYSGEFRKLQKKAQLLSEFDPRCRSRLIHTLEVSRIAKEISDNLGLDTELTEAIALAHDLGNVAHGKPVHDFLAGKTPANDNMRFCHEEASELMLLHLTKKKLPEKYIGIASNHFEDNDCKTGYIEHCDFPNDILFISCIENKDGEEYYYHYITPEVCDGVKKHGSGYGGGNCAYTLEGQVVAYADSIAYLCQDIDDFMATNILSGRQLTQFKALRDRESLVFDKENYGLWVDINIYDDVDLKDVFSSSRSKRLGALIKRYTIHNVQLASQHNEFSTNMVYSDILKMNIPVLSIDDKLQTVIDVCWKFIERFYDNLLIKTSNMISLNKVKALWEILSTSNSFTQKNPSFRSFGNSLSEPIFLKYREEKGFSDQQWNNWKLAYFISYLSEGEIDLIVDSFLQRDYTFELDI